MHEGELYTGQVIPKGWTIKTNGLSQEIIVRDPDCYDDEGHYRKKRTKPTNITPKKKKRKKWKKSLNR